MNLECTLQKESAKKLQSAINGEVWSRMVPRSAVGLLSLRLCSCGRAARTARGWFETAPVSHCYLSLLFWTSARLSGFCPLFVCAWTCGCVTDTPQYVRSAPRSQISEDHSDWHATAMRRKAAVCCIFIGFRIFQMSLIISYILETKARCLPVIKDAAILSPEVRRGYEAVFLCSSQREILLFMSLPLSGMLGKLVQITRGM